MRQNYLVYNGKRYSSGTIVILSRFDCMTMKVCKIKAKFLWHDVETNEYGIEIYGKEYIYTYEHFCNSFLGVYEHVDIASRLQIKTEQTHTFSDEIGIEGLLLAWIWYVFIMFVGVIFYDRIGIWIFASIVFFKYRDRKLKEAGYK